MREVNAIIIHCSDTPADMDIGVTEIDEWHRARGWNGIGYHYVVRRNGLVEKGRGEGVQGAHAYGHNADSIGVCVVGGMPICNFTAAQWDQLKALILSLTKRYPGAKVIGHRDVSDKPCPMFDAVAWAESLVEVATW